MRAYFPVILLFLCISSSFAQDPVWDAHVSTTGMYASNEVNPFWFTANKNGQFGEQTTFSLLGEIKGAYYVTEKSSFSAGAALYYRNEVADEFQRRDLYLQFKNTWLKATLGAKKDTVRAQGLSSTNKDFLRSGNNRPLAGLLLEAPVAIKVSNTFSVDWAIAHYQLNDERYVDNVRLHYKRLSLITKLNSKNKITAKMTHYAQWGGNSPDYGELPGDFSAFYNVFFAKLGASDIPTEAANALGNHLGSYFLDYQRETSTGILSMYHEHPFEDGSGSGWSNIPDGVWGVHFQSNEKSLVSGFLYEYVHTKNQSYKKAAGADNYFNNGVYRSGWSYENRIIGMPFFIYDPSNLSSDDYPFISNRTQLHHLGFTGWWNKLQWTVKTSYVLNTGTYVAPFASTKKQWYNYLSVQYSTLKYGKITGMLGLDIEKQSASQFGAGFTYQYLL